MRLTAEKKRVIKRRALYAAVIVGVSLLQNTPGLFPVIFSARAFLLIPAVVCIAMFEGPVAGLWLGLLAGLAWDAAGAQPFALHAVFLTAAGYAAGVLVSAVMRNNLVSAALLGSAALALYCLVRWLASALTGGASGLLASLAGFYLPSFVYSFALTPVFYIFIRAVYIGSVRKKRGETG